MQVHVLLQEPRARAGQRQSHLNQHKQRQLMQLQPLKTKVGHVLMSAELCKNFARAGQVS